MGDIATAAPHRKKNCVISRNCGVPTGMHFGGHLRGITGADEENSEVWKLLNEQNQVICGYAGV